jgi:L-aspartate oxidase
MLPEIMWSGVGPIRDARGLVDAISALGTLPVSPHRDLCALVARAALARTETRGVHVRADHPETDPSLAARSFDRLPKRMAEH